MRLGKDKKSISLAFFLLITASAFGQAGKTYKFLPDGNLQTDYAVTGNRSVIINYSAPELNIENIVNTEGTYYRLSIPGHISTTVPGKPELPVYCRLISIPEGADYQVKISGVISSRINPSLKRIKGILYPSQVGETKEPQKKEPGFVIDKTEYASKGLISSDTVRIEPVGKAGNVQLSNIVISPVRYNPHSNTLDIITSMKIEVSFRNKSGAFIKSLLPQSALFNESLSKEVINLTRGDVIPGFTNQPVKMIIITDTAFRKQLEPFIKWKTQKGFKVIVLYKGTGLAGNNYTQLKVTLTKIYNASSEADPPPEYLLIIGDVNRVPYYGTGTPGNITDMYYGEFNGGGDYIPEMYVGRLPVADTTELKTVVHKIIQYEKFQFADTNKFYNGAIATAGNDAGYANYMNGQVKYAVTNYLTAANKIKEQHFYYPQTDLIRQKDSITRLINQGTSFINYSGHGDASGWLHLNIKSADITSLTNKYMYPFIISNACRTAEFDNTNSFGNRLVVTADKGAIGFIGCSNDSYWDEDYYWAVGPGTISANPTYTGKGLGAYDRLFHTHAESPSDWCLSMGQINFAGNLAVSASTSSRKKYYWETYNVVGDPSVIPIIGKPVPFNISLPDTLPNGIKSLSLNVVPFSYVAISHSDTLWDASYASASGSVVLDLPGLSNDSCMIVITGQNRYPIIKTIHICDLKKEFLNLSGTSINDSQGNNNSRADYGEHISLKIKVSNLGLTDANNVYSKISSTSDWLKITSDSVFIGRLPARSDLVLSDNLGISVSDSVPDMGIATVNLLLKTNKSEKHYNIDVVLHSPELQIINCTIDDKTLGNGDNIAEPGETFNLVFKIQNLGSGSTSGQFNIFSPAGDITVLTPSIKSGELKFGETTEIPIMVKLSETASSGSSFSVSSTLDCNPYLINKKFYFRVGKIRESFEASSFSVFPWINISAIPWIISGANSFDGRFAARSGAISHNGSTSLLIRAVYPTADSLTFYYKVSCEFNYDFLEFKLNGIEILKKSGDIPWTRKVVAVHAGINKMEWIYKKDQSVSAGDDCAWIDMIDFAQSGSVKYIQKDLQIARIEAPVRKDNYGLETVTVKVLNPGKDILNGFNLAYMINDVQPPVTQFFENQVLPNGDTVTVSFNTKADLSKYGIYKLVTYGFDNKDDFLNNDTLRVSLENSNLNTSLSVFPNPFDDKFTVYINLQNDDRLIISIINVTGAKVYSIEKNGLKGKNIFMITDPGLLPSVYYLNIKGNTLNKTIPVIRISK
jgi:hypothetical protein